VNHSNHSNHSNQKNHSSDKNSKFSSIPHARCVTGNSAGDILLLRLYNLTTLLIGLLLLLKKMYTFAKSYITKDIGKLLKNDAYYLHATSNQTYSGGLRLSRKPGRQRGYEACCLGACCLR
jgi:hypothetical protein